jgi:hypothetical protein
MTNIKKDIDISNITVDKKRYKRTGINFDDTSDTITINYDILALNASNVVLFKYGQDSVIIPLSRFEEAGIAPFILAADTMTINELPSI